MRQQRFGSTVKVWLSACDTERWATRPGSSWPCSQLRGRRVFAEFQNGDLVDLSVDNGRGEQDIDCHEFNACIEDHCGGARPGDCDTERENA